MGDSVAGAAWEAAQAAADELYERLRRRGEQHEDAMTVVADTALRFVAYFQDHPPHPNPAALFHKIGRWCYADFCRDRAASAEDSVEDLSALEVPYEGTDERASSAEVVHALLVARGDLARIRLILLGALVLEGAVALCMERAVAPGSPPWRAALYTSLGMDYATMVAVEPGTTNGYWATNWRRARLLLAPLEDPDDEPGRDSAGGAA